MSYIKGSNEFFHFNEINPLLITSTYFLVCSVSNLIKNYPIEAFGMAVVATTSILYHLSYCICNKDDCNCTSISKLIPYSEKLRYIDMIPNLIFGVIFTIKAYFDGNYTRIFWATIGILGYMLTYQSPGIYYHLIYVHLPVIMGFLSII
jgi:hypothetical protein